MSKVITGWQCLFAEVISKLNTTKCTFLPGGSHSNDKYSQYIAWSLKPTNTEVGIVMGAHSNLDSFPNLLFEAKCIPQRLHCWKKNNSLGTTYYSHVRCGVLVWWLGIHTKSKGILQDTGNLFICAVFTPCAYWMRCFPPSRVVPSVENPRVEWVSVTPMIGLVKRVIIRWIWFNYTVKSSHNYAYL